MDTTTTTDTTSFPTGVFVVFLLIALAVAVAFVVAAVAILRKAGYSGWWVLVYLVPLVGTVMFFVFAFSKWPVLKERDALRQHANQMAAYPGYAPPTQGFPPPGTPPQQPGW